MTKSLEHQRAALDHMRTLAQQGDRKAFDQMVWSQCEAIRHYLHSIVLDNAGTDYVVPYVNDALPRFLHTLGFLPLQSNLRVLELGANPYLFSILLKRFLNYDIQYANFFNENIFDTNIGIGTQRILSASYGESHIFHYKTFNLELCEYPYPDEHFDLVLFCEILEHLAINPLSAFARLRHM